MKIRLLAVVLLVTGLVAPAAADPVSDFVDRRCKTYALTLPDGTFVQVDWCDLARTAEALVDIVVGDPCQVALPQRSTAAEECARSHARDAARTAIAAVAPTACSTYSVPGVVEGGVDCRQVRRAAASLVALPLAIAEETAVYAEGTVCGDPDPTGSIQTEC